MASPLIRAFNFGYRNAGAFAELNLPAIGVFRPEVNFNQTNYRTGNPSHFDRHRSGEGRMI